MVQNYAEMRIREAIKQSNGNALKTRKLLEKWCLEDSRLMGSLMKPHMTGILAHAIERVTAKLARGEPPAPPEKIIAEAGDDMKFGKELLKNLGMGDPAIFAQESFKAPIGKKAASKSHIDAIKLIASKRKS